MSSEFPEYDPVDSEIPVADSVDPEIRNAELIQNDSIHASSLQHVPVAELQTSYLHPLSIVFSLLSQVRQNLLPAGFALFGAAKGNLTYVFIAIAIFIPSVALSVIRYFTLRYSISNGELTVEEGLIFRRVRKVPTAQIQNVDLVQNILHRVFKVAEVRVETASGTKPEATLRVLSLEQVELLRERVRTAREDTSDQGILPTGLGGQEIGRSGMAGAEVIGTEAGVLANATQSSQRVRPVAETLLKIPLGWLIKAGLASNRGLVMIGVLIGALYQWSGDDNYRFDNFDFGKYLEFLPSDSPTVFWGSIVLGTILTLLAVRLLGVGWFILRFFGYKLDKVGNDLKISCGLFTKVSATVPIKRVQFISIHRPMIMRWLGLASIRIETAGGAGNDSENATATVSKRWFIPVVSENRVSEIVQVLRPGLKWVEGEFDWQPLAPKAGKRFVRLAIMMSLLVVAIGLGVTRPWGWIPGVVLSPLFIWHAIKKSKAIRYARMENGIVYRSGIFTRKTSVTFFDKVQAASLSQSPFDKRWNMATLAIDTAASGPANHQIIVAYLDETFAKREYRRVVDLAAHH